MKLRYRSVLWIPLMLLGVFAPMQQAAAATCFDVRVDYMGRDFVGFVNGVAFYRWHYRVTGEGCISKAMSHWTLQVCQNYWSQISEVTTHCVDNSDPPNGMDTYYTYAIGLDPTTGIGGLKWNTDSGNVIDTANEYDDFSFICPGSENLITVEWGSKSGQILEFGTTTGPSCDPTPTERPSWGRLRSIYR